MIVLGLDTSTQTAGIAITSGDRVIAEARHDTRGRGADLLVAIDEICRRAGVAPAQLEAIAIGAGPGSFTGLRIGMATAKGIAFAARRPLWAVSSLAALAHDAAAAAPAGEAPVIAAVLDARRGEVFAAAWDGDRELLAPAALAPAALAERLLGLDVPLQAVGDGAVRFRQELEGAGVAVPVDGPAVHRIAAAPLCRLGAVADPADRDRLLPDYRREPDAKPPQ